MVKKNIALLDINSNPNIGLYMFANDKLCLIGTKIDDKKKKEIEGVLGVNVYEITALGTELVGVFIAGNNDFIIIPQLYDYEEEKISKIAKENNLKVIKIKTRLNTFGNNVTFSNDGFLFNPEYSKEVVDEISKKTSLNPTKLSCSEFKVAGSIMKCIEDRCFLSQQIDEEKIGNFRKKLCGVGTINSGSNMISSGVVGNKNGILIGSASTAIEVQNVVESFEYI